MNIGAGKTEILATAAGPKINFGPRAPAIQEDDRRKPSTRVLNSSAFSHWHQ